MTSNTDRSFDADAFAQRIKARMARLGGLAYRELEAASGVSLTSLSRILRGWPDVSHENVLRLEAWLASTETIPIVGVVDASTDDVALTRRA